MYPITYSSYNDIVTIITIITHHHHLTKSQLVNLYKKEKDPKVKERLLLVIRVMCDHQIPYHVVKEMNRSNPWASDWLKRYGNEGIDWVKRQSKKWQKTRVTRRDKVRDKDHPHGKQSGLDDKAN